MTHSSRNHDLDRKILASCPDWTRVGVIAQAISRSNTTALRRLWRLEKESKVKYRAGREGNWRAT